MAIHTQFNVSRDLSLRAKIAVVFLLVALMSLMFNHWVANPFYYLREDIYRLQTQAFLYGKLAYSERLQDYRWDMALTDTGWHQIWGLGIPVARLPLDFIAAVFGYPGMPDMLCLFLFFSGCMVGIASSLQLAMVGRYHRLAFVIAMLVVAGMMIPTAGMRLMTMHANKHEQAISYNALWPFLMMALMLVPRQYVRPWHWWCLVVACGLQPWFRPTGVAYTLCIMPVVAWYWNVISVRQRMAGCIACASIVGVLLFLNYLRFASPLNFGHSMNIPPHVGMGLIQRFHLSPPRPELLAGFKEIVHLAFFMKPENLRFTWESNQDWMNGVKRWRELELIPFAAYDFWVVVTAWVWLALPRVLPAAVRLTGVAYYAAFLLLLVFYSRLSIASARYVIDMLASVEMAWLIWFVACWRLIYTRGRWIYAGLTLTTLVVVFHDAPLQKRWMKISNLRNEFVDADKMRAILRYRNAYAKDARPSIEVPESYECKGSGGPLDSRYGLRGWNYFGDCKTRSFTAAVLKSSPCVKLTVETDEETAYALAYNITMQSNSVPMGMIHEDYEDGMAELKFCATEELHDIGYRQVVWLWFKPDQMFASLPLPWKFMKIENTSRDATH